MIKNEQELNNIKKTLLDEILDYLGRQTLIHAEPTHYFGAQNRVSSMLAPYTGKRSESPHHEHYDSLFWEMLLHNDIIPKESDLYIHSKDGGASEKSFDDLKNEWVVLNKGNLEKYSETAQPEVIQNPSGQSQEFLDSQNTFAAYGEGRHKQMMEAVDILPHWEYISIGDSRVRPAHAALNGTVRRYDDPFWNTWYPPNGFNCRCVVEVTTKEPTGKGVPSWNKELADRAMEAGSPMTAIDRHKGVLSPDKGFARNDAGMSHWIGEKGEQAIKKAFAFGVDNASKAGVRTQLLKTTEVPIKWDESKNILVKDNITTQNAVEIIQKQVNANGIILDFDGTPVFVDPKEILKHITDNKDKAAFEARKVILPKIKEILSNPQEAWGQFEKYPGKNGTLVFAKKYLANINGEPYMLVAEFVKTVKDKGMPVLTTVYKLDAGELLNKRSGVLLK